MTTTKTVTKVPQSFTLNQIGVDDIIHSYTYKYEEDNGTWSWNVYTIPSETGILTPIDDTNKPKNVYTINSPSSVTCNVSPDCCKTVEYKTGSTDFPFLDIEVDCFYAYRSSWYDGSGNFQKATFNHNKCGFSQYPAYERKTIGGVEYDYYHFPLQSRFQRGSICGEFSDPGKHITNLPEDLNYRSKNGYILSASYDTDDNNYINIYTSSTYELYDRPYKLYPQLYFYYGIPFFDGEENKNWIEDWDDYYKDNVILTYNIYIDWKSYISKLIDSLNKPGMTGEQGKYSGVTIKDNGYININKTVQSSNNLFYLCCIDNTTTYNDFGNFNILYEVKCTYKNSNGVTNTFIKSNISEYSFDDFVNIFSPDEHGNPASGNNVDAIFQQYQYFDSPGGYRSEYPTLYYQISEYPALFKFSDLNNFSDGDFFNSFSNNVPSNDSNSVINISTKIAIIHRQYNVINNTNIPVFGVKIYSFNNPLSIYKINTFEKGLDINIQHRTSIDVPIMNEHGRVNSGELDAALDTLNGILGTVNLNLDNNNLTAGTIYSAYTFKDVSFLNDVYSYHYIKSDEDGNQFICTGSCNGNTLTWTSNSRY